MFAFDNSYARLPAQFFQPSTPSQVAAPRLIRFNSALARELGLAVEGLDEDQLAAIFSGNSLPAGAHPIAMAYAGHQFGNFVPQLGDGRAVLLGEVVDIHGARRDIQLKGAGATAFSRRGDGRAALGPVLREYIVSEAMHALSIPTTRALAAVATGEPVYRETALPGAVLTRVAASHIRVGTFQFFAARNDRLALEALADHVIARHYPDIGLAHGTGEGRFLALLEAIASRQAQLIARWMAVGFVHGVMNTDNMTVSGETIDFGPCAFLDEYDPRKVFSSIDQRGRYAYGNQPAIGQWNIARLAECFLPLIDEDEDRAVEAANAVLRLYGDIYQAAWLAGFSAKIGLDRPEEGDLDLVTGLLELMQQGEADFTRTFRALGRAAGGGTSALHAELAPTQGLAAWLERWQARLAQTGRPAAAIRAAMDAVNPALIPRNHRIEEAIQAALYDDDSYFERLVEALTTPFAEDEATADLRIAPRPEERVMQTFCGT